MVAIPLYLLASSSHTPLAGRAPEPSPGLASQDSADFYSSVREVIGTDFPDPSILYVDGTMYGYSTNSASIHIPMATSTDNQTFTVMSGHDALPQLAPWENPTGHGIWAPDVIQLSPNEFVMYYASGTLASAGKFHCIGAATALSPTGPFIPRTEPLICPDPLSTGGAIDPEGFLDPATGKRYIVYKHDGNAIGHGGGPGSCNNAVAPIVPTPLMLQEVDASDGVTLVGGAPVALLDRDDNDGPLVEAPSLVRSPDGVYFLFFSSNCFNSPLYATSYATSTAGVSGPYTKTGRPLLVTGDGPGVVGPGGLDAANGAGGLVSFHGHVNVALAGGGGVGGQGGSMKVPDGPLVRAAYIATATYEGTKVSLQAFG